MVLCTLFSIITLGGIVVNADTDTEMLSAAGVYDFFIKMDTNEGSKTVLAKNVGFKDIKTDENMLDHLQYKDLYIFPEFNNEQNAVSANLKATKCKLMYFNLGYQQLKNERAEIYALLCYANGTPIYVDEKDNTKTISGKNLSDIQNIRIYQCSEADLQNLVDQDNKSGVSISEKWSYAWLYDISKSDYVGFDKNGKRITLDDVKPQEKVSVMNTVLKKADINKTGYSFAWSDFVGDSKGYCKVALYKMDNQYYFIKATGNAKDGGALYLCTNKNTWLKHTPEYRDGYQVTTNTGYAITEVIAAGVYTELDKDNNATNLTDAYSFSNSLTGDAEDMFKVSIKSTDIGKSGIGDINVSGVSNDILRKLYTLKVDGKKFNKVGYWYIAVDFVLGDYIDAVNTKTRLLNSWEHGQTRRAVIGVNEAGAEKLQSKFTNRCDVVPSEYDIEEENMSVRFEFTGTDNKFECKVAVYDVKDINISKLTNTNIGTETTILKSNAKALYAVSTKNLVKKSDIVFECKDENFKVSNNNILYVPVKDTLGEGTYYVEIAARPINTTSYIIKWIKVSIGKMNNTGHLESVEESNSTTSKAERIEANRELTFAEERKIDNLNKEIDNKLEMDRWAWVYIIMAVCGIVILVYSLLLIVAYYFDLFNSLTEVSFYHKLTFGHMYPVGSAANIEHLKLDEESKVIYATHKTAWISFAIGVIASSILLNGRAVVVAFISLVNWFSNLISNIGG